MTNPSDLDELDRRRRLQRVDSDLARSLLARDAELEALLATALRTVTETLGVPIAALLRIDEEAVSVDASWARSDLSPSVTGQSHSLQGLDGIDTAISRLTLRCRPTSMPVRDLPVGVRNHLASAGYGEACVLAVPLVAGTAVLGAMCVLSEPERRWADEELAFMESVAGAAWSFLARHRNETALSRRAAEAEVLATIGASIVDLGSEFDRAALVTILELLGTHIGASAVGLLRRSGDTADLFAEWNPGVARFEPITLTPSQWEELAGDDVPDPIHRYPSPLHPIRQDGEVIALIAIEAESWSPEDHRRVIEETAELLRQLRVRAYAERDLRRQRRMEDLRSAIATSYVEAEHWQVVETTVQALARIGHATRADAVMWVSCAKDQPVTTDRLWTRPAEDPPTPSFDDASIDRLLTAAAPYTEPGTRLGDREAVVIPVRVHERTEGALVLMMPSARPLMVSDLTVLGEIALLVQQMEEWALVEAETEVRRQRLQFQATHDELTGLGNRRLLVDELRDALTQGPAAVLMIDMDRFKVVNDSLGHSAGDVVLTTIADRLRLSVREHDLTCRFGGDEFAIMVPRAGDAAELAALADRLIDVVREPVTVRATTVIPTCSIGIAVTAPGDDLESVLRHADAALYQAKGMGRDRFAFFDDDHRESLRGRLALETSLRQGLRNDQFVPWFQPEVDLLTQAVVGVEALIRWIHPTEGVQPASSFIEVAEEAGLAPAISRIALESSCQALVDWRHAGLETRVRVNVASGQLRTGDLDVLVAATLERYSIPPRCLCVEITESSLMVDFESSAAALRQLRRLGVEVAIDDFGTGFSSLARLRGLPIDTLKIDRSFVSGLLTSITDRNIVATIIGLANAVGLKVVAEGVEQAAQADALVELGCYRAQGWLWAGALPPAEIPPLLESGFVTRAARPADPSPSVPPVAGR